MGTLFAGEPSTLLQDEMKSGGSPCWLFALLFTTSLGIQSTFEESHSLFIPSGADIPRALEQASSLPSATRPNTWPDRPGLRPHPQTPIWSESNHYDSTTVAKSTPDVEIRGAPTDQDRSTSAGKTEVEDPGLLADLLQCQLFSPSSARPLRTSTDNKLHKRSINSKQKCNKIFWKRIRKSIRRACKQVRRKLVIWFLKFLIFFESRPAKRAMLKVKLAEFLHVNW
ncbi:hypothetical protein PTTG_05708 [Puccinia triticina 1-1 BBBD Race 1]|uniref:Uncharacterized protein n=1 Tax=Puccinia triticina (isolate 1-1 / race 1 (BBBD)) TaxID=630390 RepID=A0A180GFM2_PUCT1|nr:hypothetical protein PTTG_05708 [Puccinia triticina 1-1 BBBD Race 1]